MKTNEIIGGQRNQMDAFVVCNGIDVNEISGDVANFIGRSGDYGSITISDLRCYEDEGALLKDKFPKLSEEAYRAILNANLRGVYVEVFFYIPERNNLFRKLIELRNKLQTVKYADKKNIENLNKVLRKYGEEEIVLDELFNY